MGRFDSAGQSGAAVPAGATAQQDEPPGAPAAQGPAIDSIAAFVRASRQLIGSPTSERAHWNTEATADAIRHYAWGISDDNPLWIDRDYAGGGPHGRLAAPPTFLFSVLYPFLHGVAPSFPLTFLISEIDCRWYLPLLEGDRLDAVAVHKEVIEARDRAGRDAAYIVAETTYRKQSGETVAVIQGTLAAIERRAPEMMTDRTVHAYSAAELATLGAALLAGRRTGRGASPGLAAQPGDALPPLQRGPLTLGDLICWQAAIGHSYRAGALGYRDLLASPHTATVMPRVGWPVRDSQQHEDVTLAAQRGMPAPFDNSTMRAAWLSVLLTDWMGDDAFLQRLQVSTVKPVIYGDSNRYAGTVLRRQQTGDEILLTLRLTGTNQLGEITTTGEAQVALPSRPRRTAAKATPAVRSEALDWGPRHAEGEPPTVCELFDRQLRERPQATAVAAGERTLTYAALDACATQLAHALHTRGIRRGSRLGLALGRSPAMAIAVLACAKSGVAYVPVDPSLPSARRDEMLAAAAVRQVLIDDGGLASNAVDCLELLPIATLMAAPPPPDAPPVAGPRAADPAYLLYTSGSTGRGKAVVVSHASLGLYLRALIGALGVTAADVCLHCASFAFSAAVRQFWLPLCTGATLVLADEETRHRPLQLFAQIRRDAVTVWDTVPSILESALAGLRELDAEQRAALLDHRLRRIFTTGEPLSWAMVRRWRALRSDAAAIVNLYSQTETAGTVCVYPVPDAEDAGEGMVALGRPLADTGVCLLDEMLQPVAPGEAGEICVAGARLPAGYAVHPDVPAGAGTAGTPRFVSVTLPSGSALPLYRTGDLGRRRADGVLQCLGRSDDQIRIRGFSIRLGDVEAAIRRDPRIERCVVLGAADVETAEGARLVAYVVPCAGHRIDTSELRARLARALPEHMLPQAIVPLDALPRNPNGKLDRFALPAPRRTATAGSPAGVAPRDERERLLGAIWCRFLRLDAVGVHDDFFDLGGHSLLATRVIAQVSREAGVELSLLDFFARPTIAALALRLAPSSPPASASALPEITRRRAADA